MSVSHLHWKTHTTNRMPTINVTTKWERREKNDNDFSKSKTIRNKMNGTNAAFLVLICFVSILSRKTDKLQTTTVITSISCWISSLTLALDLCALAELTRAHFHFHLVLAWLLVGWTRRLLFVVVYSINRQTIRCCNSMLSFVLENLLFDFLLENVCLPLQIDCLPTKITHFRSCREMKMSPIYETSWVECDNDIEHRWKCHQEKHWLWKNHSVAERCYV